MGFFDSMKGFLGGVGNLLGTVATSPIGQQFLGAGLNLGFESLFGRRLSAPAMPGGAPVRSRSSGEFAPRIDPRTGRPVQFPSTRRPAPQMAPLTRRPFQSGTFARPTSTRFGGATAMPHFPGDRMDVSTPFVRQAGFELPFGFGDLDIPGIDLQLPFQLPFRADPRGGTEFFHDAGEARQRPRALIMQMNPTTGTPTFFRHAGRPIMFSGDRALCKRIDKIARRAGRSRPRR